MIATRTLWMATVVAFAGAIVAGCGERPQVISYKQGTYQGKPDTPAYSSAQFNGNRQQWEDEMRTRNQAQNEYKRIGG